MSPVSDRVPGRGIPGLQDNAASHWLAINKKDHRQILGTITLEAPLSVPVGNQSVIAQRELGAHWETLRALGDNGGKPKVRARYALWFDRSSVFVSQCAQGLPVRTQFALRNNRLITAFVRWANCRVTDRHSGVPDSRRGPSIEG